MSGRASTERMAVLVRNIDKAVLQSSVLYGYFHRRFPGAIVEAHIASDHRDLDAANDLVDQARPRPSKCDCISTPFLATQTVFLHHF